jgi:tyrosine-protein phosphatase SIW14
LIGVPWAYCSWRRTHYRNFHVVREGVLYRSGQLHVDGLRRLVHDYGIKTVVTLRYAPDPKGLPPDLKEERFCKDNYIQHFRLRHRDWEAADKSVPAEVNVQQFLEIMSDPANHPVLVHCFAGIHRTGAFCALYRMEFDGWSNEQAVKEMKELGYADYHRDVFAYLRRYQPRGYLAARHNQLPMVMPAVHCVEPPTSVRQDR